MSTEHEILTLEEVAEYLRVSVRTVYDWAQKAEIPCGKLGGAWRFKRSEIEQWLNDRLGRRRHVRPARAPVIREVLDLERVILINCATKKDALNALLDRLTQAPEVEEPAELVREIFRREDLMSTGIGLGIGIPHVRLSSVKDIVMAVGINQTEIADYVSALHRQPVRIICMVAARWNQHPEYLKLLSAISALLRDEAVRKALLAADTPAQAYGILTQ